MHALMSIIHEGLHGNLGNIANPAIRRKCKMGTKYLIVQFIEEVKLALDQIYQANEDDVDFYEKLSFLKKPPMHSGAAVSCYREELGWGSFIAGW